MTMRLSSALIKNLFKGLAALLLGILTFDKEKIIKSLDFIYINIFYMTTLPIQRPGPFIDYSTNTFVNQPAFARDFIDPINGACDESEYWKWKYYLKSEKYNFTYGENPILTTTVEEYNTFENRKATDFNVTETKKLTDDDSVLFQAGWSYIAPQPLEWELTYNCKNNGTSALHGCFVKYSYPGLTEADGQVVVEDVDNGEVNEIQRRVKITLPKTVFPRPVSFLMYSNVGEDIGEGAEIEFQWKFGPVGSFVD